MKIANIWIILSLKKRFFFKIVKNTTFMIHANCPLLIKKNRSSDKMWGSPFPWRKT